MTMILARADAMGRAALHASAFSEVVFNDVMGTATGVSYGDSADGIAHAVPNPDGGWTLEVAGAGFVSLAGAAASAIRAEHEGPVILWVHDGRVPGAGFELERTLHRMERPLPAGEMADPPAGVVVRAFRVGLDEKAWLEVNNRAFGGHPEQGGWRPEDLAERMTYSWFDPDDMRLFWEGDDLVAFNWMKVERREHGLDGQIFVIGVDPVHQGRGLGMAAAVEGLRHVYDRHGAVTASLYVDDSNQPGMKMYETLGFATSELHRAYRFAR